ncbi:MAG: hypothetical protein AAF357_18600 [Verrucomicrobiota bacterium]
MKQEFQTAIQSESKLDFQKFAEVFESQKGKANRLTMSDIAKGADVSVDTVSRTIRKGKGTYDGTIRQASLERIIEFLNSDVLSQTPLEAHHLIYLKGKWYGYHLSRKQTPTSCNVIRTTWEFKDDLSFEQRRSPKGSSTTANIVFEGNIYLEGDNRVVCFGSLGEESLSPHEERVFYRFTRPTTSDIEQLAGGWRSD